MTTHAFTDPTGESNQKKEAALNSTNSITSFIAMFLKIAMLR